MANVSRRLPAPISRFCRQYLQLEAHLTFPDGLLLREDHVQELLFEQLFAPGAVSYPPPPRYKLKVLKDLVARVEEAIEDWDEHVSMTAIVCWSTRLNDTRRSREYQTGSCPPCRI